jgi:hypothetical protein
MPWSARNAPRTVDDAGIGLTAGERTAQGDPRDMATSGPTRSVGLALSVPRDMAPIGQTHRVRRASPDVGVKEGASVCEIDV